MEENFTNVHIVLSLRWRCFDSLMPYSRKKPIKPYLGFHIHPALLTDVLSPWHYDILMMMLLLQFMNMTNLYYLDLWQPKPLYLIPRTTFHHVIYIHTHKSLVQLHTWQISLTIPFLFWLMVIASQQTFHTFKIKSPFKSLPREQQKLSQGSSKSQSYWTNKHGDFPLSLWV